MADVKLQREIAPLTYATRYLHSETLQMIRVHLKNARPCTLQEWRRIKASFETLMSTVNASTQYDSLTHVSTLHALRNKIYCFT